MKLVLFWIRRRPLISFFVLCFLISWGIWLPYIFSRNQIFEVLALIGIFGPALACVLIARTVLPIGITPDRARHPWIPFTLAWLASTLIFVVYSRVWESGPPPFVYIIFAILGLVPAFIISSTFSGNPGMRKTLATLIHPRGSWGWYLLALLLPSITRFTSATLSTAFGWGLLSRPNVPSNLLALIGSIITIFLYTFIYAGGLNEEAGWTGFALPRLQAYFNPLIASIILWFFWILWHVPLHLAGLFELNLHVLIGTFFARFIFTWLYIRSSGGILTALLFHASANVASQFIPNTYANLYLEAALAIVIIISARMWIKLPSESLAVGESQRLTTTGYGQPD